MTDPKHPATVRVRVAVAVDAKGVGYCTLIDQRLGDDWHLNVASRVAAAVNCGQTLASIIEADIPLPAPPAEVEGEVAS